MAIWFAARPTSESPDVSCFVKQILQNPGSGETLLAEVSASLARAGHLLILTEALLVFLGPEKMLFFFGQTT